MFFQYVSFAQSADKNNRNRLIVKFKSNIKYAMANNDEKFKLKEFDKINKKNRIQSIILSGNKKKGDTYILNFESNQEINQLIKQYKNTNLF